MILDDLTNIVKLGCIWIHTIEVQSALNVCFPDCPKGLYDPCSDLDKQSFKTHLIQESVYIQKLAYSKGIKLGYDLVFLYLVLTLHTAFLK